MYICVCMYELSFMRVYVNTYVHMHPHLGRFMWRYVNLVVYVQMRAFLNHGSCVDILPFCWCIGSFKFK